MMTTPQQLTRRSLISDLGRGTLAIAILGPAAVACGGSDGSTGPASTTAADQPESQSVPSTTVEVGGETTDPAGTASGVIDPTLAWHQVSFGFVFAYLLVRGTDVAIVDTGLKGNSTTIEEALTAVDRGWADVGHVVLTHLHGDHIGGLPEILDLSAAAVAYAGAADVEGIDSPRALTPLNDGDEVFGMEVIATPGHTAGHIAILDPAGSVLVAGDAVNTEGGQVTGANPEFTPDMDLAAESIRKLATRQFDTVVVGHGDPVEGGASDQMATLAASL